MKAKATEYLIPKIAFSAEVDDESTDATITLLSQAVKAGARAIVIEFNTPGGSVNAGFKLAKAIEQSPIPVHCVVDGQAASMGLYLLQSCTTRTMTSRSILMAHEPAIGVAQFYGSKWKWFGVYELLRTMAAAMNHHMSQRMNISYEEFCKRIDGKEWWMASDEALAVAAVDSVIRDVPTMMKQLRTTGRWL
jgi:ATP-dependent protease ClpP protease subunit